jgi:hypothetical protein
MTDQTTKPAPAEGEAAQYLSDAHRKTNMAMRTWNVRVHRGNGRTYELGQVHETNEANARCAALSKYGAQPEHGDEDTPYDLRSAFRIYGDDDFDVTAS